MKHGSGGGAGFGSHHLCKRHFGEPNIKMEGLKTDLKTKTHTQRSTDTYAHTHKKMRILKSIPADL